MSEFLPDFNPDFGGATIAPSPNHGERQGVAGPDIILLHYTGMTTADGALSWLCNPESQVSSHYFVFEDGRVMQLVAETRRAWHAGKSSWAGRRISIPAPSGLKSPIKATRAACRNFRKNR